jgi:hypothetical protein
MKQVESVQKLLQFDLLLALPGHGHRFHVADAAERLCVVSHAAEATMVGASF